MERARTDIYSLFGTFAYIQYCNLRQKILAQKYEKRSIFERFLTGINTIFFHLLGHFSKIERHKSAGCSKLALQLSVFELFSSHSDDLYSDIFLNR